MAEERKSYEQRAEIIAKRLLSKIYAQESKALEAKMDALQNKEKLEKQVEALGNQREELEKKYYDLVNASESQWQNVSEDFEKLINSISSDKQDFYERAQGWLNDLNKRIADLEEKARNSRQEVRESTQQQLATLREQRERLQKNLVDMQHETGERWKSFRDSVDEGLNSMKTSINKVYQYFQRPKEDSSSE
jgi:DNA repair exonuclease SbcCD ATPase subunit